MSSSDCSSGPERLELSGYARSMLYLTTASTGFRSREVCSLTWASFDFGPEPTVSLSGKQTKNRKRAVQPIRREVAAELSRWRQERADEPAESRLWPLHPSVDGSYRTAELLRADLTACGIDYRTEEGVADFHSLRAAYETWMLKGGASQYGVQKLMRHSSPRMTAIYDKLQAEDLRGELDKLPAIPIPTLTLTPTERSETGPAKEVGVA